MQAVAEKRCRRCDEVKAADEFKPAPRLRDGLSSWCRDCHRAAQRRSREKHRERYNAARRKKPEERTCPGCGATFEATRGDHRYCTRNCPGRPHGDAAAQARRRRDRLDADPARRAERRRQRRAYDERLRARMAADPELRRRRKEQKRASDDRRLELIAALPDAVDAATCARLRAEATHCATCDCLLDHDWPGLTEPTIDHLTPLAAGGRHELRNLRVVCRRCNVRRPRDGRDVPAASAC